MDIDSETMPVENSRLSGFFKLSVDEEENWFKGYPAYQMTMWRLWQIMENYPMKQQIE